MKIWLLLIGAIVVCTSLRGEEVAFIAHPTVQEGQVTAAEVKNILLGTKTNWNGGPLKLAVQAAGTLHAQVIQQFTHRSADQFEKYWKKQVFTGKGTMPMVAKSDGEMIAFVASTAGAFGYVASGSVTDAVKRMEVK